ncbi:MAG: VOC family protein [Verrucomicrobiota bacterium]
MSDKIDAQLSPNANLEQLKNQAKRLLKDAKAKNPHAKRRLERAKLETEQPKLADAQTVIARENGFSTWTDLKRSLESSTPESSSSSYQLSIENIDQIWLDSTDLEATEHFYSQILNLPKTGEVPGQMLFFDCGGTKLLLGKAETCRPNSILYLKTGDSESDIQATYNSLKNQGVKVGDSPHCIAQNWNGSDHWIAFFHDPSGNQLALKTNVPTQ